MSDAVSKLCTIPLMGLSPLALALSLVGCIDDLPYDSLPGPKPGGCDRSDAYDVGDMTADLAYLASPELDGRYPGSEGDVAARAFISERFACLGLDDLSNGAGYQQAFTTRRGELTGNVLAMIPGEGARVSEESIVISAHVDHFGDGLLGANDNASGVTALLAIAQDMVNRGVSPDRTLVFAVFGAEESGFEGSKELLRHPPAGLDTSQIVYNVNMDMVGSYTQSGVLYALGTFNGTPGRQAVSDHAEEHPLIDVDLGEWSNQSDNVTFCEDGVPYVFFWTEDQACYHSACDTSGRVDYASVSEIAQLSGDTSLDLANSGADLAGAVQPGEDVCFQRN